MYRFLSLAIVLLLFFSCGQKKPTAIEGEGKLKVTTFDDAGQTVGEAEVVCVSFNGQLSKAQFSDSRGITIFTDLPSSKYTVKAMKSVNESAWYVGSDQIFLETGEEKAISVTMRLNSPGLKINEIYYAGPVNDEGYYQDQFIELYNASDDTAYLDGTIIIRGGASEFAGKDNDNDGDLDFLYYNAVTDRHYACFVNAFRLSGTPGGTTYPVAPAAFVVLAVDAIDHRQNQTTSIDLSHADFEFYTKFDPRDPNNPDVPDYVCMITGEHSWLTPRDLSLSVETDIVLLASGTDSVYWDGIDLDTIIDGVEYANNKDLLPRIDARIDRGIAGIMPDEVIPKFSGESIERIHPGFDTNNGVVDFIILKHPTPGY
ncbi:MAG: DUF4876 domain-containing protein [Calditrichaeota bacterium]|nr:DUF4876 domain-containing protein [Calditrichota bacterium]